MRTFRHARKVTWPPCAAGGSASGRRPPFCGSLCLLLLLTFTGSWARAETGTDLYSGQAIVTGQENLEERQRGFREALAETLVKVTGDSRLSSDARVAPALVDAQHFVSSFTYEDRLAKKKPMDEQGTRERSYILRVNFGRAAVDQLLAELGVRPWPADRRPRLLVLLVIQDSVGTYLLAQDSRRGWGQREALATVAARRGVPVTLPHLGFGEEEGTSLVQAEQAGDEALAGLIDCYDTGAVLQGRMIMRDDGTWDTRWTLRARDAAGAWRSDATTFDRSIASGIEGAALHLAAVD